MTEAAVVPAATSTPAPAVADAAPVAAATVPASTPAVVADAGPAYDLKAPDGFDAAALPKLVEIAKSYGISPENAQKLVADTHARQVAAQSEDAAARAKVDAENLDAIRADKDFGGEKMAASLQRAQQVVDKLEARVPGLKAKLEGAMNDPVVVRLFNILGEGNREDTFAAGGGNASGAPKSLADLLYPKP